MKVKAVIEFHIHDGRVTDAIITARGSLTKPQADAIREWFAQKDQK